MRWRPPPPLCDCCRRVTLLERIVWRIRRLFTRRRVIPFTTVRTPKFSNEIPRSSDIDIRKLFIDDSMTAESGVVWHVKKEEEI